MVEWHKGSRRARRRSGSPSGSRALAAIVVAVALALAATSTASAQPQRSAGTPQWILFTARQPGLGSEQIFRVQSSGKGLKQLTKGADASEAPAFSPDGKRIAFARVGAGIYTMNVDGTGLRAVTHNGRDSFPTWSPDGTQIAFIRPVTTAWKVYVSSASGANARELTKSPPAGRPSWTSRGLLVPTNGALAKIDPRSGQVQKLFNAVIDASIGIDSTAVAPDLSSVTSVGPLPPDPGDTGCGDGVPCQRYALYFQNLHTQNMPKILLRNGGPATYSPDGKSLAFISENALVLRVLASGASKSIKTGKYAPTTSTPPAWQPR
jgi:Tol biopolymer transport system component